MLPGIDRVYAKRRVLERLGRGDAAISSLAKEVASKGSPLQTSEEGPYPVETGESSELLA